MGLDDLRQEALQEEQIAQSFESYVAPPTTQKIFGMTAAERMIVSVGCFLVTSLGGFLLLLILEKIEL